MRKNLLAVFLLSLLTACSGQIKGSVFLDANDNGTKDDNEKTLTNVTVKVTQEDNRTNVKTLIAKAKTDAQGQFAVSSKGPGYYCVEVEEPGLSESLSNQLASGSLPPNSVPSPMNPNIGVAEPPAAKSLTAKEVASTTPPSNTAATTTCCNNVVETGEECDDGNKASGDNCSSDCKKEKTPPPPPPPPKAPKKSSGVVCEDISSSNFTLHVPVALDYQADIANMPPRLKQTHKPGDPFSIDIAVPAGCVLKSLFVPDSLEVSASEDPNINVDPSIGRVNFAQAMEASSVKLQLKVKENIPLGTSIVKISPEALCPDGKTFELNPFEIELKAHPQLQVLQSITCPPAGQNTLDWEIKIQNRGSRTYEQVTLLAIHPSSATINTKDPACSTLGEEKMSCPVESLSADSDSTPLKFKMNLPSSVTEKTTFVFRAQVTSSDFSDPISAQEGECILEPSE